MFACRTLTQELVGPHVMQADVERDYCLLGVTGVEDVLQDNV
jgi:magnesium-transporting ATPase (P-type)